MEVETKKTEETESDIKRAMRARVKDFKEQADSLTLEGVRRALEKDLGMKTLSLDVHKRFIKQCLEECFYGGDDADLSTTTGSAPDPRPPRMSKETLGEKDEPQQPKDPKSVSSDISEGAEEFPAVEEKPNHKSIKADGFKHDDRPSEDTIKKAIKKRASFFRANLEKITLAKVRRLLEEDLNLQKNTLDAYKSFISEVLDEVLQSPESTETTNGTKKKPKKVLKNKKAGKLKRDSKVVSEDSGSSDLGNDVIEADEDTDVVVKRLKKRPLKKSKSSVKPIKKQKTSSDENITSVSGKKKREEIDSEIGAESDNERSSENVGSHSSSDERPKKRQEKPTTQSYGKHVEHLKSVIKACGMGVPPAVYKRAKQAPDSKREAFLIKELEDILAKEGLSTNPSDKEIKSVKRKKERAKELEGIDMSNIVSTSRRRSSINFIPTPKQKMEVESDEDEEDEVEEDEDDQEGTDEGDDVSEESSEGLEKDAEADAAEDSD